MSIDYELFRGDPSGSAPFVSWLILFYKSVNHLTHALKRDLYHSHSYQYVDLSLGISLDTS